MYIIIAIGLGIVASMIAGNKGRSRVGWFIYGFLIAIVAIPHALLISDNTKRPCPYCKEKISKDATVCPFCRNEIPKYIDKFGKNDPVTIDYRKFK